MQRAGLITWRTVALSLMAAMLSGCGGEKLSDEDQVKAHLRQILMAYNSSEKPPRSMEDLRSSLNDMHVLNLAPPAEEVLVSSRDKQPIVVIFGLSGSEPSDAILAYEQQGVDGKRWVATLDGNVTLLTNEEFSTAKFAAKHKPGGA